MTSIKSTILIFFFIFLCNISSMHAISTLPIVAGAGAVGALAGGTMLFRYKSELAKLNQDKLQRIRELNHNFTGKIENIPDTEKEAKKRRWIMNKMRLLRVAAVVSTFIAVGFALLFFREDKQKVPDDVMDSGTEDSIDLPVSGDDDGSVAEVGGKPKILDPYGYHSEIEKKRRKAEDERKKLRKDIKYLFGANETQKLVKNIWIVDYAFREMLFKQKVDSNWRTYSDLQKDDILGIIITDNQLYDMLMIKDDVFQIFEKLKELRINNISSTELYFSNVSFAPSGLSASKSFLCNLKKLFSRKELKSLKKLDLSNNYLKSLPEEIGDLINLKTLNLRGNILKSLPKAIAKKLKNLNILNLSFNNLNSIDVEELTTFINVLPINCKVYLWANDSDILGGSKKLKVNEITSNVRNPDRLYFSFPIPNEAQRLASKSHFSNKYLFYKQKGDSNWKTYYDLQSDKDILGLIINAKSLEAIYGNKHSIILKNLKEVRVTVGLDITHDSEQNLSKLNNLFSILEKIKDFEKFDFFNCYLRSIPSNIINLKNLKTLNLIGNKLNNMNVDKLIKLLNELPTDCKIDLSNNGFSEKKKQQIRDQVTNPDRLTL